ncbi:hypothetical protein DYH09_01215 [bacterium CPR1]|nr:hypothetical protein [bacterium CPR1]
MGMSFLFIGLFVYLVGLAVNALSKRPAVNPGKIALVVLLLLMLILMTSKSGDPGNMGYVVGSALVPMLGFWFASRQHDQKHRK